MRSLTHDDAISEKIQLPPNEASEMQIEKEIKTLETRFQNMEAMQCLMNVALFLFGMFNYCICNEN